MKYFIDENGSILSGDEFAEYPDGLEELPEEQYLEIVKKNEQAMVDSGIKAVDAYVKSVKDRYDRLVRNGWDKEDARIESGLDQIEDVK